MQLLDISAGEFPRALVDFNLDEWAAMERLVDRGKRPRYRGVFSDDEATLRRIERADSVAEGALSFRAQDRDGESVIRANWSLYQVRAVGSAMMYGLLADGLDAMDRTDHGYYAQLKVVERELMVSTEVEV